VAQPVAADDKAFNASGFEERWLLKARLRARPRAVRVFNRRVAREVDAGSGE
jgi:hypothetical protein